jgi:hypothetical protein
MTSLPFGKYKNKPICDVPFDYLEWLLRETWPYEPVRRLVFAELERRHMAAGRPAMRPQLVPTKPTRAEEKRLVKKGWLRSDLGRWSRWIGKTATKPGWCCYQCSLGVAKTVQAYLDSLKAKRRAA